MTEAAGQVGFVGLGMMGAPMAARLVQAGFSVHGYDASPDARAAFEARGGRAAASAAEAARNVSTLITMLPDGKVVHEALLGPAGIAEALAPGALVVDMSSSAPLGTRELAQDLGARGFSLIDAPVSGGVVRAEDGSLAIMVGGEAAHLERARPLLAAMGSSIFHVGPIGAGHAAKALNNFVSASGFAAACEAVLVAQKFGIDPATLIDVINASTGRNNSTENKMKPQVFSGAFASGFSLALMAKDLRTAADLADALESGIDGPRRAAELWSTASSALGPRADHTEIYRFLGGERASRD